MKRNTQTKFCVVRSGYSSRLDIVRAKKEENLVIRRRAKRVRCDQKKARMYQDVRKLIENEVRDRWLNGIPMTRPDIYRLLKQRYVSGELNSESFDEYDKAIAQFEKASKLLFLVENNH